MRYLRTDSNQRDPLLILALVVSLAASCRCSSSETRATSRVDLDAAVEATDSPDAILPDRPMRCIENVPPAPAAEPSPPLAGVVPAVLWTRVTGCAGLAEEPVMTDSHIGIVCANTVHIFDLEANQTGVWNDFTTLMAWGLTADVDGDFYFGATLLTRVTPQGAKVWATPLAEFSEESGGMASSSELLLSPEGIVLVHVLGGKLKAISTSDGSVLWERQVGSGPYGEVMDPYSGVGDTFFLNDLAYTTGGANSPLSVVDGLLASPYFATYTGLAEDFIDAERHQTGKAVFTDFCGKKLWAPEQGVFMLSGFHDELLVGRQVSTYVYSSAAEQLHGPAYLRGWPKALGADNTLYSTICDADENLTLVANSWDLKEQWAVDLGKPCAKTTPLLADDGVMYIVRETSPEGITITAVQTPSPGLAHTAMPTLKHDNRRTNWLSP